MTGRYFPKTWEELEKVEEQLKCVICGLVPNKLYSTNRCEHKYCEKCSLRVHAKKLCFICDMRVEKSDMKIDKFYSEIIPKVQLFAQSLKEVETGN